MLNWDQVRERDETRCVDELRYSMMKTIYEEWPLSECANVSYIERETKWWAFCHREMKKSKIVLNRHQKDARSLKRHWTVLLRVRVLCRWRCLNIVTRAHDTNNSMRVQIEWVWNETFRREKRSVNKVWTFGEMVRTILQLWSACVCMCVCIM